MPDDLFAPITEAEDARLRAAGWRQDTATPGYWWRPDGRWKEPREQALRELEKAKDTPCSGDVS